VNFIDKEDLRPKFFNGIMALRQTIIKVKIEAQSIIFTSNETNNHRNSNRLQ